MSKSSIIESLLAGYIEGRLSPEEKNQFFDLLADSANESVFRNLLMKNIDSSSVTNIGTDKEKDFSNIYGRMGLNSTCYPVIIMPNSRTWSGYSAKERRYVSTSRRNKNSTSSGTCRQQAGIP